jgi:uncharacterized membrane protein YeaQ/YmgE (transglycosylase-associated protein family)
MVFYILGWLAFGLIVGLISKWIHPGDDPVGFLPTAGIGIAGSFVGGGVQWVLNMGGSFSPAGFLWSIAGGVLFCYLYRRYKLGQVIALKEKQND